MNKPHLQPALLTWFYQHKRNLPWRQTNDPYKIWVSEIMLQQTQVATVIPYYERWIRQFPTPSAAAKAPQEKILKAWEGLGYYSRARNLQTACREIVSQYHGKIPDTLGQLQQLPGIGRYTASAILSIAYNKPVPLVDGNVTRVLSRLFAIKKDPRKNQILFWKQAEKLLSKKEPGSFNQALMELGATVCTPTNPSCLICPIAKFCQARKNGIQDKLPVKKHFQKAITVWLASALIQKNDKILLCQRPPQSNKGHLADLWELPTIPIDWREPPDKKLEQFLKETLGISVVLERSSNKLDTFRTRYKLHFLVYRGRLRQDRRSRNRLPLLNNKQRTTDDEPHKLGYPTDMSSARWISQNQLASLPLPGLWAKFFGKNLKIRL